METVSISSFHKTLLSLILQNKYVASHIMMGDKKAAGIEIKDDGSIRLYTKKRCFKWLCILFGDFKDISFKELSLILIDLIAGPDNLQENIAFDGMTKEFMKNAVRRQNYQYVIDMLFDNIRYGMADGEYTSQYINSISKDKSVEQNIECLGEFSSKRAKLFLNSGDCISNDLFIITKK